MARRLLGARSFREHARQVYLSTLFRARGEHSPAGVLAAAEAFERLGDREVAAAAHRMLGESPRAASR